MHFLVKAGTLFWMFASVSLQAQQTSERRENFGISASRARTSEVDDRHGTTAGLMSSEDRLLVMSAALGRQGSRSKPDCSHLVHEIYSRAGFPYTYANSSDLYSGINEFHRVTTPQVADLIVWPGHMGIIVSPTQHSFYSSLRSGVGVDFYDSLYWRRRGKPRFYRYVKRTITADVPSSLGNTGSEEESESSAVSEPANMAIMDALAVESVRPDPEKIRDAFLRLSKDYGNSLRAQDLFNLRVPVIVFDQVTVEKMKVKGKKGSVELRIDGPLSLSEGRIDQKKRRDRQRWTIDQSGQSTWQVRLPAAIYLSRDDAVKLFAQQLAILTDGIHNESSSTRAKAELAQALNALLAE